MPSAPGGRRKQIWTRTNLSSHAIRNKTTGTNKGMPLFIFHSLYLVAHLSGYAFVAISAEPNVASIRGVSQDLAALCPLLREGVPQQHLNTMHSFDIRICSSAEVLIQIQILSFFSDPPANNYFSERYSFASSRGAKFQTTACRIESL